MSETSFQKQSSVSDGMGSTSASNGMVSTSASEDKGNTSESGDKGIKKVIGDHKKIQSDAPSPTMPWEYKINIMSVVVVTCCNFKHVYISEFH